MIDTERLTLRPMALEDGAFIFELVNSQGWIENIGKRDVHSVEDGKKYIQEKMIDHYEEHGYGNYLMIRKQDGAKIGCVSLYNRPDVEGTDIGFALLPAYYSMGYALEGAMAIKTLANHSLGLTSITAFTTKENILSQKLIDKLGLKFKKEFIFEDEEEPLLFYELVF